VLRELRQVRVDFLEIISEAHENVSQSCSIAS
jgi:hypothetical protein